MSLLFSSRRLRRWRFLAAIVSLCPLAEVYAFDYAQERRKEASRCEGIDRADYQSGLLFNPDGHRSFYVRSKCLQEAAVRFRDPKLCDQVRERKSLLSSSWAYSSARCRQLVSEGVAVDRRALEAVKRAYAAGGVQLRDFRVERNGNGRDIDIIPAFAGGYAHGYVLTFEILEPGASSAPALLHSSGYHLDDTSNLRIYVPEGDIKRRLPGFARNRVYAVRATVTLDVGFGSQSGYWSEAFIERVFPVRERSQVLTRHAAF